MIFLLFAGLGFTGSSLHSQILDEELLSGPDAHELPDTAHGHLFGNWGGARTHLLDRGVKLDLHYIDDSLWDIDSPKSEQMANWGRFRGTIDIDFGKLIDQQGLSFHATAVWQAGGNLGSYLGLIASPTGLASMNTFRLDSWWFIPTRWEMSSRSRFHSQVPVLIVPHEQRLEDTPPKTEAQNVLQRNIRNFG